jgi:hypothetical protein
LREICGEVTDVTLNALQGCPSEIKLALMMAFDLKIDLSNYKAPIEDPIRFPSPLLNETTTGILEQALGHDNINIAIQIYDACPPEQTLLAIAIAALKNQSFKREKDKEAS